MDFDKLFNELRKEWPVIKQAPLIFAFTLTVISSVIWGIVYMIFKENLGRKDDLIKTLHNP